MFYVVKKWTPKAQQDVVSKGEQLGEVEDKLAKMRTKMESLWAVHPEPFRL